MTSSWFFLSTLNYDARSTTHQSKFVYNTATIHIQTMLHFVLSFRLFAEGNFVHFKTTALKINLFFFKKKLS